jgi:DNA-binding NarL/FixJ family response regulator
VNALDGLGLTADQSLAYRELLTMPSATPAELSARLGCETSVATLALVALEREGLVARSGEDLSRYVASPPGVTLGALLVRRQNEIRVAEVELAALDELYRTGVADRATADVVDVVRGPEAIRQRFEQLQLAAREEVMAFVKAPAAVVSTAENTAEDEAVARGVRYRVLLEREMLDTEPGLFDHLVRAVAAGEEVRMTDRLPIKLLVVDHELAFVPMGTAEAAVHGALLVRRSGLLDALCALYESEWSKAIELNVTAPVAAELELGPIDAFDAQVLSLLLVGLNDKAIAYHLETSLRTVQRRVRHLMDRAGARTRTQLGWKAARLGWSPPTPELAAVEAARDQG